MCSVVHRVDWCGEDPETSATSAVSMQHFFIHSVPNKHIASHRITPTRFRSIFDGDVDQRVWMAHAVSNDDQFQTQSSLTGLRLFGGTADVAAGLHAVMREKSSFHEPQDGFPTTVPLLAADTVYRVVVFARPLRSVSGSSQTTLTQKEVTMMIVPTFGFPNPTQTLVKLAFASSFSEMVSDVTALNEQ
ncbi:uncharacterized protein UTRI_02737 [Ustilago trichophora]|uniref:Uncharacterized protein n=1 Tax=Ustilago trichophora TaxID=86804 RepID=A0A5C3EPY2_9BASI|nr:uncharacterized protein UTRI_02737 [Ustilago trichophora]